MPSAPHEEASQTNGRPRMAVITPLHPICELASRASDGIEVTLIWTRRSDELRVCVNDTHTGFYFELEAERDTALDDFHHPYAYAAARGITHDRSGATPAPTEPLWTLAA
jgi:hypothetical protein